MTAIIDNQPPKRLHELGKRSSSSSSPHHSTRLSAYIFLLLFLPTFHCLSPIQGEITYLLTQSHNDIAKIGQRFVDVLCFSKSCSF